MASPVINTREDLDAIIGTPEYDEFILHLAGTMKTTVDVQTYPDGYNRPDYKGDKLSPIWQEVEDLTTIKRFGFTKQEITKVARR
jgi:hypothetical protein